VKLANEQALQVTGLSYYSDSLEALPENSRQIRKIAAMSGFSAFLAVAS
jgi:hypothetical protein